MYLEAIGIANYLMNVLLESQKPWRLHSNSDIIYKSQ